MRLRIIRDQAHNALFNMQADRYLLEFAEKSGSLILRTYFWSAPAISLGCMQNADDLLDPAALRSAGAEWIHRPTGGRAVLHWNDLTYCCVFPTTAAAHFGRSIAETYSIIAGCLSSGLLLAGIDCGMHDSDAEYRATSRNLCLPCFLSPSRNELMVEGRKLVGSAQKRTSRAVLQHGSIPLDGSFRQLGEFLSASVEEKTSLRALLERKCICAHEVVPALEFEKLSDCIIRGFTKSLPLDAYEQGWENSELRQITGPDQ